MPRRKFIERPTTIDGLTEYRRPLEIGRIKIGEKVIGCKKCKHEETYDPNGDNKLVCPNCGNTNTSDKKIRVYTRPAKLDYFKIVPDDESLIPLINELYGEKPTAIDVKLPVFIPTTSGAPDPDVDLDKVREMSFPQSYTWFKASGLQCTGDGIRAVRYISNINGEEVECNPDKCKQYIDGDCSESARLFVYVYRLPTFGVFRLSTRSVNSIIDINTGIDGVFAIAEMIAGMSGKPLARVLPQLPLRLRVKEATGRDETGKKTVYNKLSLDIGEGIIPYLARTDLQLGAPGTTVAALPAGEGDSAVEQYVETDPDKHRFDLIGGIKDSPPYKIDEDAFPDGKIEYDIVAAHTARAKDFTESIIGRREGSLDKLTTPELEKLYEAVKVYEPDDGMYTEENGAAAGEDIRKAEAAALILLVKKIGLKQGELAGLVNEKLKPENPYKQVSQAVIESWGVDTITAVSEHLYETFKEVLEKMGE